MHSLTLEGRLTQPQPPRGHVARTRVTDSATEATGPGPVGQLRGGEAGATESAKTCAGALDQALTPLPVQHPQVSVQLTQKSN